MNRFLSRAASYKNISCSLLFFYGMSFPVHSQNIDSLKNIWRSTHTDAVSKYNALGKLSEIYAVNFETDSALVFHQLQISLAREMGSKERELESLLNICSMQYDASRYEEALDSLEKALELCLEGENPQKLPDIYRMFGIILEAQGDPEKSLEYFTLSYQASLDNQDSVSLAKALNSLGISNQYYLSNYQQAINYYLEAIAINKALGRTAGLGNNYYNLSGSYYGLGNTVMAITYQLEALKYFEQTGDTVGIQDAYNSIGNTYSLQRDTEKAMEYFVRSLNLSLRTNDLVSQALVRINIGNLHVETGEFEAAGDQLREGVRLLEQIGNSNYLDHGYLNLGKYYIIVKAPDEALIYLEKAEAIARRENDEAALSSVLAGLGGLAYEKGNYRKSLSYLQEAVDHASKLDNKEALSDIYHRMFLAYGALGDVRNELMSYQRFVAYRDSIIDMQSIRSTTRQEMEFQFSKKQLEDSLAFAHDQTLKELEIRKGKSQRNFALLGMVLLVISTGLVYRQFMFTRKARKRSDELLLNILPSEVAQELKETGKAEARGYETVSILFTDFKGFTKNAAKLTANELIREINTCFEAFDQIMEKYGIEKIKTIGDGYMAAGGLPIPKPGSCTHTVLAALEMQEFITKRAREKYPANQLSFKMRLGIHTGPVVAGIVGVKKFQYDIWGDTVNTASRMESAGAVGKVNISQTTYDLIKNDPQFSFQSRGEINVKGKGRLPMYFVGLSARENPV